MMDTGQHPAHRFGADLAPRGPLGIALRAPPNSMAAEQALLGALLANNKAYDRVCGFLRPDHFADAAHAGIYQAIQRQIEAGRLADVVTLRPILEHAGILDDCGGPGYLAQLLSAMVGIINAGEYGHIIVECWRRRGMIDIGEEMVNAAFGADPDLSTAAIAEAAETRLLALSQDAAAAQRLVPAEDAAAAALTGMAAAMERGDGLSGLTTGLANLNRFTGGLQNAELIIIAGRPGMGKTGLMLTVAARAAQAVLAARRAPPPAGPAPATGDVLFASAEMDATPVAQRLVAALSGLPVNAIIRGHLEDWNDPGGKPYRRVTQAEFEKAFGAAQALRSLPLVIDEAPVQSVASIRARARAMRRGKGGLSLIVVDYLQLLRASMAAQRQNNRVAEVSEISRDLKALAKEFRVPVVVGSQLSREVEKRADKRPMLADLRDSGTIEQDADTVWFVYRAHYYLKQEMPQQTERDAAAQYEERLNAWHARLAETRGKAELIIGKQRQGSTGPVPLRFHDATTWFRDMDEDETGPAIPGLGEGG